ncbi:MAG: PPOX class F420-dependent oxidoreductase [Actinomycetia bacterium]|nr:PPOX class F420-dependent oxidoreductase [Actinomycetes bacterium]
MELAEALEWAAGRGTGTLITLRSDGRAQSSDIAYVVDSDSMLISVTADRAKTANMRRDPRIVVHVSHPTSWSYVSFDALAELSPVAASTDDETVDRLVAYYETMRGEPHPDWDEYRQAMVDDKRLLVTVRPQSVVGMING